MENLRYLFSVGHGDAGFVVAETGDHRVVASIHVIDGVAEIVGIEICLPYEPLDDLRRVLMRRVRQMSNSYRGTAPIALPRADVRALKYSALLEVYREGRATQAATEGLDVGLVRGGDVAGLRREDMALLEPLADAEIYLAACRAGVRKPSEALERARTISPRTAQNRVARARDLGLLTRVRPGSKGGELTPLALEVQKRRQRMIQMTEALEKENTDG